MMASHSEVRVAQKANGSVVLQLVGDHDMATAGGIETRLGEALAEGRGIVVDLSDTAFIDSTVIRTLLRCHEQLEQQGRQLVLQIQTQSPTARILEISMVADALRCVPDREEAIALASQTD